MPRAPRQKRVQPSRTHEPTDPHAVGGSGSPLALAQPDVVVAAAVRNGGSSDDCDDALLRTLDTHELHSLTGQTDCLTNGRKYTAIFTHPVASPFVSDARARLENELCTLTERVHRVTATDATQNGNIVMIPLLAAMDSRYRASEEQLLDLVRIVIDQCQSDGRGLHKLPDPGAFANNLLMWCMGVNHAFFDDATGVAVTVNGRRVRRDLLRALYTHYRGVEE